MIPAKLIPIVIETESSGNVFAESPTGAKGLMQIEPATWNEWASKLEIPLDEIRDIVPNLTVGIGILDWLYDHYHDLYLTLAAYNWGIGHVDSALRNTENKTWNELLHFVPKETANYVTKIMQKYNS